MSSTVVPAPTSPSITCHSSVRPVGSSPVVGSSRKSTGGSVHERGGEVEAPAHATGEVAQQAIARVDEVELLEEHLDAIGELGSRNLGEPPDEAQVLARGEVLVDRRVLTGEPDRRADRPRVRGHIATENDARGRDRAGSAW